MRDCIWTTSKEQKSWRTKDIKSNKRNKSCEQTQREARADPRVKSTSDRLTRSLLCPPTRWLQTNYRSNSCLQSLNWILPSATLCSKTIQSWIWNSNKLDRQFLPKCSTLVRGFSSKPKFMRKRKCSCSPKLTRRMESASLPEYLSLQPRFRKLWIKTAL